MFWDMYLPCMWRGSQVSRPARRLPWRHFSAMIRTQRPTSTPDMCLPSKSPKVSSIVTVVQQCDYFLEKKGGGNLDVSSCHNFIIPVVAKTHGEIPCINTAPTYAFIESGRFCCHLPEEGLLQMRLYLVQNALVHERNPATYGVIPHLLQ